MTRLIGLAIKAIGGTPHENLSATLLQLGYLSDAQREEAARIYAALIGERSLPVNVGRR